MVSSVKTGSLSGMSKWRHPGGSGLHRPEAQDRDLGLGNKFGSHQQKDDTRSCVCDETVQERVRIASLQAIYPASPVCPLCTYSLSLSLQPPYCVGITATTSPPLCLRCYSDRQSPDLKLVRPAPKPTLCTLVLGCFCTKIHRPRGGAWKNRTRGRKYLSCRRRNLQRKLKSTGCRWGTLKLTIVKVNFWDHKQGVWIAPLSSRSQCTC